MTLAEVRQTIPAPRERVWCLLTDHSQLARWLGLKEVVLRQEGYPDRNGVGALRVIRDLGVAVEEEIIGFDPPKRMRYRLLAGMPIRDHQGELQLEPCAEGTEVSWQVRFDPVIWGTGWLIRRIIERWLGGALAHLAAELSDQDCG